MFYNSTEIEEKLKCSYCKEVFVDVVKLIPECGESICGLCYEELRDDVNETGKYKCKLCNQSHEMPKNGLPDIKSILRMLEAKKAEKPLSEQAKVLKRFVESAPNQLRELETFDERDHISNHCDQLEVEVIEEFDSLVKHLNEIEDSLIKQIREYRERCLESISARSSSRAETEDIEDLSALVRDLKDFYAKWSDYFSKMDAVVADGEVEAALNTTKLFETRMRSLDVKLKNYAFGGQIMKFRATHSFLGEFKPLVNLFTLSLENDEPRIQPTPLATLTGHSKQVNQAIFLGNDMIASCSDDMTIKIWSVENRSQLFELKGHSDWVISLALLHNGWLASGSCDKTIIIWDLEKRKLIKTLLGHANSVASLKTLKNGNLVSYSLDDTVRVWNPYLAEGNLILTITGHGNKKRLIPFDILPNDNVVTCSRDDDSKEECIMRVWNSNDGSLVTQVSTGCNDVWPVLGLSNDQVALGFDNGTIKIVNLMDCSKTRTREKAHPSGVSSLALMANGSLLSSGLDFGVYSIKIWNTPDLALLQTISSGHSDSIPTLSLSPNQELLASASNDKTVKLWQITHSY